MVFRFCPQILEDDLLHKSLHQVPVLHYPVTDGPLEVKRGKQRKCQSLLEAEIIQTNILSDSFFNEFPVYLCCIWWFVDGFVPDEEVQVIDAPHHPALGLVSDLGGFFDGDTWRSSWKWKQTLTRCDMSTDVILRQHRKRITFHNKIFFLQYIKFLYYSYCQQIPMKRSKPTMHFFLSLSTLTSLPCLWHSNPSALFPTEAVNVEKQVTTFF